MPVRHEKNGSTVVLTLDRPDKLNALDYATIAELQTRLGVLTTDVRYGVPAGR